jgi:hypothetical protein
MHFGHDCCWSRQKHDCRSLEHCYHSERLPRLMSFVETLHPITYWNHLPTDGRTAWSSWVPGIGIGLKACERQPDSSFVIWRVSSPATRNYAFLKMLAIPGNGSYRDENESFLAGFVWRILRARWCWWCLFHNDFSSTSKSDKVFAQWGNSGAQAIHIVLM